MTSLLVKSKPKVEMFKEIGLTLKDLFGKYGKEMEEVVGNIAEAMAHLGIKRITLNFQSQKAKKEYLESAKRIFKENVKEEGGEK